jgi:hypothetical protein
MTSDPTPIDPGEKMIWSGSPDPRGYALRKGGLPLVFGIFYASAALYWSVAFTAQSRTPNQLDFSLMLFGVSFAVLGAGLVLLPVWHYFRGRRTTYTLTNRRVITAVSGSFPRRINMPLTEIPFVDVRASIGGPGHVLFQEPHARYGRTGLAQRDGFIAIPNAARVGEVLRAAIETSAGEESQALAQGGGG